MAKSKISKEEEAARAARAKPFWVQMKSNACRTVKVEAANEEEAEHVAEAGNPGFYKIKVTGKEPK